MFNVSECKYAFLMCLVGLWGEEFLKESLSQPHRSQLSMPPHHTIPSLEVGTLNRRFGRCGARRSRFGSSGFFPPLALANLGPAARPRKLLSGGCFHRSASQILGGHPRLHARLALRRPSPEPNKCATTQHAHCCICRWRSAHACGWCVTVIAVY